MRFRYGHHAILKRRAENLVVWSFLKKFVVFILH